MLFLRKQYGLFQDSLSGRSKSFRDRALSAFTRIKADLYTQLEAIKWRFNILLAFSFMLGAGLYFSLTHEPDTLSVGLIGGGIVLNVIFCGFAAKKNTSHAAFWLLRFSLIGLALFSGFALGKIHTGFLDRPEIYYPDRPMRLEGQVIYSEHREKGTRHVIEVQTLEGFFSDFQPRKVRVTSRSDMRFAPGRQISCLVKLSRPAQPSEPGGYDFARVAYFAKLDGIGFTLGDCKVSANRIALKAKPGVMPNINAWRSSLAEAVAAIGPKRGAGLAAAMVTGDRGFAQKGDADMLREIGMAHILAISGLHMGLVGGVLYFVLLKLFALIHPLALRVPLMKLAAIGALTGTSFYLLMSGGSISAQRAYIMTTCGFLAILMDRRAISLNNLAFAMVIVTALAPHSVVTPGFQMSFAATAALIAAFELYNRRQREAWASGKIPFAHGMAARQWRAAKSGFYVLCLTSFVATIATAPFGAFHFDKFAGMGFAANIIMMPIISALAAPLGALSLLLAPLGLSYWPLWGLSWSLELFLYLGDYFASFEGYYLDIPYNSLLSLLLVVIGIGVFALGQAWLRYLSLPFFLIGSLMAVNTQQAFAIIASSGDVFINTSTMRQFTIADETLIPDREITWLRLGYFEGDGLRPFRFDGLKKNKNCQKHMCVFELKNGPSLQIYPLSNTIPDPSKADYSAFILAVDCGEVSIETHADSLCIDQQMAAFYQSAALYATKSGRITIKPHRRAINRARPWRR